jgi:hypothetical protein
MLLPRMTTRRWMILVVLISLAFEARRVWRHWNFCMGKASQFAAARKCLLQQIEDANKRRDRCLELIAQRVPYPSASSSWEQDLDYWRRSVEPFQRMADWDARRMQHYLRAGYRTWAAVPPEPE